MRDQDTRGLCSQHSAYLDARGQIALPCDFQRLADRREGLSTLPSVRGSQGTCLYAKAGSGSNSEEGEVKIGDKVVCVDDKWFKPVQWIPQRPVRGRIYVVREVRTYPHEPTVLLIGLHNPNSMYYPDLERGFYAWRFRLLSEMREESKNRYTQGEPVRERPLVITPQYSPKIPSVCDAIKRRNQISTQQDR